MTEAQIMDIYNLTQEKLAEEIVTSLIKAGLVDEKKRQETLLKMLSAKMKQEDWSLLIELSGEVSGVSEKDYINA